jgi:hypothetical protein
MSSFIFAEVKIIKKSNVFMRDEVVVNKISSGAETPSQPRNPPIDYYPSTQRNTSEAPITKSCKKENEGRWYLTDQGAGFVQHLNCKLERIIDASTNIERTFKNECLRFSFQRNTCSVVLIFPKDFPNSSLIIVCNVPGSSSPLKLAMPKASDLVSVEFVDQILRGIKDMVPTVW